MPKGCNFRGSKKSLKKKLILAFEPEANSVCLTQIKLFFLILEHCETRAVKNVKKEARERAAYL